MGTKYSSVSISGYNSSPPPDDGTISDANKVEWQKHLDKIGGPLKTLTESINTAIVAALDQTATSTTATATVGATHHNQILEIASTVTTAVTINLSDAATMAAGYVVNIHNLNAVEHTLGRITGTDTINGTASNVPIAPFSQIKAWVNATANGYLVDQSSLVFSDGAAINAATQAQQEAGSSVSQTVTPGRQHYHPSAAKFWLRWDGSGTTVAASYNVTSVTNTGTGDETVTIATDFSSDAWCCLASANVANAAVSTQAAGTVRIVTTDGANPEIPADGINHVVGFGDQ